MARKNSKNQENQVVNEVATATETMVVEEIATETAETVETTEAAIEEPAAEAAPTQVTEVLVQPGKQGVSNTQLIPAMKIALDNNDIELVKKMVEAFPAVYDKSYKYFQKKYKVVLDANGLAR